MAGTIRDYIIQAGDAGISADEAESAFLDKYGVPLDSFKGKLDTNLSSIPLKKTATEPAVAPEPVAKPAALATLPGTPEPKAVGLMYQEPVEPIGMPFMQPMMFEPGKDPLSMAAAGVPAPRVQPFVSDKQAQEKADVAAAFAEKKLNLPTAKELMEAGGVKPVEAPITPQAAVRKKSQQLNEDIFQKAKSEIAKKMGVVASTPEGIDDALMDKGIWNDAFRLARARGYKDPSELSFELSRQPDQVVTPQAKDININEQNLVLNKINAMKPGTIGGLIGRPLPNIAEKYDYFGQPVMEALDTVLPMDVSKWSPDLRKPYLMTSGAARGLLGESKLSREFEDATLPVDPDTEEGRQYYTYLGSKAFKSPGFRLKETPKVYQRELVTPYSKAEQEKYLPYVQDLMDRARGELKQVAEWRKSEGRAEKSEDVPIVNFEDWSRRIDKMTSAVDKAQKEGAIVSDFDWASPRKWAEAGAGFTGATAMGAFNLARGLVGLAKEIAITDPEDIPPGMTMQEYYQNIGEGLGQTPWHILDTAERILTDRSASNPLLRDLPGTLMELDMLAKGVGVVGSKIANTPKGAKVVAAAKVIGKKTGQVVGKVSEAAVNKLPDSVVMAAVKTAKTVREARATLARKFADGISMGDPTVSAAYESIVSEPAEAANLISAMGERKARLIKKGVVEFEQPDLVKGDVRSTPKPAGEYTKPIDAAKLREDLIAERMEELKAQAGEGVPPEDIKLSPEDEAKIDEKVSEAVEKDAEARAKAERPEVRVGPAYVPEERLTSGQARIMHQHSEAYRKAKQAGTPPAQALKELFPELPDHQVAIIEEAEGKAGQSKKAALEDIKQAKEAAAESGVPDAEKAVFDPQAPMPERLREQWGMPEGSTMEDAARRYMEHLNALDVDKAPAILSEFLKRQGYTAGIENIGNWMRDEVQANLAFRYMLEPKFGAAPMPATVTTTWRIEPGIGLVEKPFATAERAKAASPWSDLEREKVVTSIATDGKIPDDVRLPPDPVAELNKVRATIAKDVKGKPDAAQRIAKAEELIGELNKRFAQEQKRVPSVPEAERAAKFEQEIGRDVNIEQEPPHPFKSTDPIWEEARKAQAKEMKDMAYGASLTEDGLRQVERNFKDRERFDVVDGTGAEEAPADRVATAQGRIKALSEEREAARSAAILIDESVQKLRSKAYRDKILQMFGERLKKLQKDGVITAEDSKRLINQFHDKVLDNPDKLTSNGKERFDRILTPDGNAVIWDRVDFAEAAQKLEPKKLRDIQAELEVHRSNEVANATHAYGIVHKIVDDAYRFMRNADGTPKTVIGSDGVVRRVVHDAQSYAQEVAKGMIENGERAPTSMVYDPNAVAEQLRRIARDQYADNREARFKLILAAEDIEKRMKPADTYNNKMLQNTLDSIWDKTFEKTQPLPSLHNLFMDSRFQDALAPQLAAFHDILRIEKMGGDVIKIVTALSRQAKRAVVPLNVKSLIYNDLSNLGVQALRRADPAQPLKLITTSIEYKKFLDGDLAGLTPQEIEMYRSINKTNFGGGNWVSKEIGTTNAWKLFEELTGGPGKSIADMNVRLRSRGWDMARLPDMLGRFQDSMVEFYQKAGDLPFRLEDMVDKWKEAQTKTQMLGDGRLNSLPISDYRQLEIRRNGNMYELTEVQGNKRIPKGSYTIDSPEIADAYAKYANYRQEKAFFDYRKTGTFQKWMSSGIARPFTGIFSWANKALDIPFVKKGLVYEVMFGPEGIKTTDPSVSAMQATEQAGLALRKTALNHIAQAALMNKKDYDEMSRAAGYNKMFPTTLLSAGNNPAYVSSFDITPLMFTMPTAIGAQAASNVLMEASMPAIADDPQFYSNIFNSDIDFEKATPKEWEATRKQDPEMYEFGQKMLALKNSNPKEYYALRKRHQDMIDYLSGTENAGQKLAEIFGAVPSPFVKWLEQVKDSKSSNDKIITTFGTFLFGATPMNIIRTSMAGAGEAGATRLGELSGYGKDIEKHGIGAGQGTAQATEEDWKTWGLGQIYAIGYKQIAAMDIEDPKKKAGLISKYTNFVTNNLKSGFKKEKESLENQLSKTNISPEDREKLERELGMVDKLLESDIPRFAERLQERLQKSLETINQSKQQ